MVSLFSKKTETSDFAQQALRQKSLNAKCSQGFRKP
jgi:hypothetical protein